MPGQPFTGRLAGLQSCCGQYGEGNNLMSLPGIKPWGFEAIGHSLAALLAELSQLLGRCVMMTTARLLPTCAEKQSYSVAHQLTWPNKELTVWHII